MTDPTYFAVVDATGALTGFLSDAIYDPAKLPPSAVRLTTDQHQAWLQDPKGFRAENGVVMAVEAPLEVAAAAQVAQLVLACNAAIVGGFWSGALDTTGRTYASGHTDQTNLQASAMAAMANVKNPNWGTSLWCEKDGKWGLAVHSAAQVHQVMSDWVAYRNSKQHKLESLKAEVAAAKDSAAIKKTTWN